MKTALIIPFYNRPQYLKQCLASLPKSDVDIILINDASTDKGVIPICEGYNVHNLPKNLGVKGALKYSFEYCFKKGYQRVINLDSDMICAPDIFTRLIELSARFPDKIISGFNSAGERNPIISEHKDYRVKRHANGPCLCVTRETYRDIVKPALESVGNWDFNCSKFTDSVIVAKPSLTQHIGFQSSMGHVGDDQEYSDDFPKIKIPQVTLFGIDAHDPLGIIRAAKLSVRYIEFGGMEIITERLFKGREGYSKFCINSMWKYIKTSHVLIIHPDGYIQNPWAWNTEWLQYDYIGATWGYKDNMNVGNGGFSLRSKKLLNLIKDFDVPSGCIEDDFICRQKRAELESKGIIFAPENVANDFSIEAYGSSAFTDCSGHKANEYTGQFGFHGYHVKGLPIPPKAKVK